MSSASPVSTRQRVLSLKTLNENVLNVQYAVRGELVLKAAQYQQLLSAVRSGTATQEEQKQAKELPFDDVVMCNIGNPQELGQRPITFFRQVLSLLEWPELLEKAPEQFAPDAVKRARTYLESIGVGGVGAYSHSMGLPIVRREVARFIEQRDGFPSDPENIFLTDGASPGVKETLRMLIRSSDDGIMIPIPQYPLYTATIALYNGRSVNYYLDESKGWSLDVKELDNSFQQAIKEGITPRALVVINPGNPTGQCLSESNMQEIVQFCHRRGLVLMADEVYQENVYVRHEKQFVSFKKVLRTLDLDVELFSYHSVSKGMIGECGKRGGYFETTNIDPQVKDQFYKLASVSLCPNLIGQIVVGLMTNPPRPGDASYDTYHTEMKEIYQRLKQRATKLSDALNSLEGVSCNAAEGAMYLFPTIRLPSKAVAEAKAINKQPDFLYAKELLERAGICVVPGSGFGQRDGTFHFRTTFLPSPEKIDSVIERMARFHKDFMLRYRS